MTPEQQIFIEEELYSMTLMATVQRGNIYRVGVSEKDRGCLRIALQKELANLLQFYQSDVLDSVHITNVESLSNKLSDSYNNILADSRFRIGSAQKALNLYLKYMWCIGLIPRPPHCPFDSVVLSRIPGCENMKWTQIDLVSDYNFIVERAKVVAGNVSLAEWELQLYNSAQPGAPEGRSASKLRLLSPRP